MISLKEFFSFKRNRFFWLNLIAMIVVVIGAAWGTLHWLDNYTRHGQSVTVPNVKGLPLRAAENEINKLGLNAIAIDSNYVKGMPAGAVLEQTPESNSKVKEGRTVYLTINTADVPKIAIPDIIDNSSSRQAEARLRAMGFKLTAPELIEGEKDWVYGVKYKEHQLMSGDKVPRESVLTLCIGAGEDGLPGDSIQGDSIIVLDDKPVVDDEWF
ncbi:MAG: PASTA domain-containing protein [Bacteroides sp.]|nr:PASTA domain-containing protein [Bacteroides sp.]MBQ8874442.1 PASTA domain-containing protein [Bacteroides sp.]